ncbi:MAG: TonB-dependent receptor plug domain-containing protein [Acidobacteria bacterium]|nr:TonB-dependent receptor plug domain-containing protein [Acidobacteriota bacterium]
MQQIRALVALSLCALAAIPAAAQTQAATLRGAVQDASGAVVPGAKLTLTNIDQNRPWKTESNAAGEYVFQQIPPGNYSLAVEAEGFKRYERPRFILNVAQVADIDVELEIGAVTETIEITAETPLLATATSDLGEVINSRTAESLPLNGRNIMQLIAMTPGINTTRSSRNDASGSGSIASAGFSANGGRDVSNTVMLDGSPQEVMGYGQPAFVPSPDAVQEFKVQTNAFSAEYGRTGGAVVNMVHRSGTQQFHGVLYEFLRNDKLQANNWFSNANGRDRAPFRFNQFGGTLGGPLTPSRQKTFFFVNVEYRRQVNPGSVTYSLPTAAMRNGDFSQAGVRKIYDPLTVDAAGNRQQFANNMIPASRQDPIAKNILEYYPLPNLSGVTNNFFSQLGSRPNQWTYSGKVDHRFNDKNNLFFRVSLNQLSNQHPDHFHNPATPGGGWDGMKNRSITLDDTYLWKGWVLHGNYGYAHHANPRDYSAQGEFMPSSLGLPAYMDSQAQLLAFPRIAAAGYTEIGQNASWHIRNKFETHTATGDMSKLFGKHTVKFGGTYRINRVSNFRPNDPQGSFTFNRSWTRERNNVGNQGDGIADLLLGLPGAGVSRQEPALADQVMYSAVYFQDDWRVSDRLTLNMGLRWDTDFPLTERFNRAGWFDFGSAVPGLQLNGAPVIGGLQFAGQGDNPRITKNKDLNNFAPRLGVAYKVTEKLVIRSGGGIFYNPSTGYGPGAATAGAVSFNAITNLIASQDSNRTPFATLANPYPLGFNQPENGVNGLATFLGQGVPAVVRTDRIPNSAQWNFNVQYQLPANTLFDVAYAGNAGMKLMGINSDLNQLPDQYRALGNDLAKQVENPFYGVISPNTSLGRPTIALGQLLRPYPQFTGVSHQRPPEYHSTYHSLQVKVRQRFSNGLQYLVAYTFSKMIDDVSSVEGFLGLQNPGYTNANQKRWDKSLSNLHTPHRLVFNYQYDLPFGKGKALLNQGGWVDKVVGGWALNGVTTFQSGQPMSVDLGSQQLGGYGGTQRPLRTGLAAETGGAVHDRLGGNHGSQRYLDPMAFSQTPAFQWGNTGNFLPDALSPMLKNWDLSVIKNVQMTERFRLEIRGEFFNLLNNVNFLRPNTTWDPVNVNDPTTVRNFGVITGAESGRIGQVALKLHF